MHQRRVQVVVQRLVLQQLARRALAAVQRSRQYRSSLPAVVVQPVVQRVVGHQLADRSVAPGSGSPSACAARPPSPSALLYRSGLLISLPTDPLPDCRLSTIVFIFARITFRLSIVPWPAFTTSVRLGVSSVFSSVAVLQLRPGRKLAVDVHQRIAQHAHRRQRRLRVRMQRLAVLAVDLHHHFAPASACVPGPSPPAPPSPSRSSRPAGPPQPPPSARPSSQSTCGPSACAKTRPVPTSSSSGTAASSAPRPPPARSRPTFNCDHRTSCWLGMSPL